MRELGLRGELSVRIVDPVPRQLPSIPAQLAKPRFPTEDTCIARLDGALAREPSVTESVSRLAWRYNLSRITVRRRVRAAGWTLPEHSPQNTGLDPDGSDEWVDTILYAHASGRSNRDIARYLHISADRVGEVIYQHAARTPRFVPDKRRG